MKSKFISFFVGSFFALIFIVLLDVVWGFLLTPGIYAPFKDSSQKALSSELGIIPPAPQVNSFNIKPDQNCDQLDYSRTYSEYKNNPCTFYSTPYLQLPGEGSFHSVLSKGESTIYDVTYNFDKFCRRINPMNRDCSNKQNILLFGNSYIFGEGVNDDQTLAAHLSRISVNYCSYNYSFSGHGLGAIYSRILDSKFQNQIEDNLTTGLYFFHHWEIQKLLRSFQTESLQYIQDLTYLDIDIKNNVIAQYTSLKQFAPLKSAFYRILGKSNILKYFHIDYPVASEIDYEKFAYVLSRMKKNLKGQLKLEEFYVVSYPLVENTSSFDRLIPYLEKYKIKYLYFRNWDSRFVGGQRATLNCDAHPLGIGQKYLANQLIRYLNLK